MPTDPRLSSLELSLALGALVALFAAARRSRASGEDLVARKQALALDVHEESFVRRVRLPAPIIIGRQPTATIVVDDAHVSRQHARIDRMDGAFVIRDLDSRNGTFVNGTPIAAPTPLSSGDRIDIGGARIVVREAIAWN